MLKVTWAAFAVACFYGGMSGIHECSGDLLVISSHEHKQTASCKLPQVRLAGEELTIDLAIAASYV